MDLLDGVTGKPLLYALALLTFHSSVVFAPRLLRWAAQSLLCKVSVFRQHRRAPAHLPRHHGVQDRPYGFDITGD